MKCKLSALTISMLVFIFSFGAPKSAQAIEYYVDQNHPIANDQNSGTEDQPWKTITRANQTLSAGDTVYIKAGTYNTYINPSRSGSSGLPIVYRNYGNDKVTISGTNYAVYLNGKTYISVQGICATSCRYFLYITNAASHNTIAYCSFDQQNPPGWDASLISGSAQYNWIHHSQFSNCGECSATGSDIGSVLDIGSEESSTDLTRYNLLEDNLFFHGGHHVMGLYGGYNTIRNNYFHNEAWSRSRGNRTLCMVGRDGVTGHNLIEGNRFGYAARPCDDLTVGNVAMSSPYNIFRYNELYHSNAYLLGTYGYTGYSNGSYNQIYNNTLFNSGYNIYPSYEGGSEDTAVTFMHSSNTGNSFRNNLYFSNNKLHTGYTSSQKIENEWNGDTMGDPLFVNASRVPPGDKTDATLPDFSLQPGSPAIDAGGALTTVAAADTGSGAALIVTDASSFQDGTLAPPGTTEADWIAVGTPINVVQILSINYSTRTITLVNSISRKDSDSIWLFNKSDGIQVLNGSAPDAGANETVFGPQAAPAPPRNLRLKKP